MVETEARVEQIVAKLKTRGYRLTPQRLAVLKILAESTDHPSAEQIYARVRVDFPMTSLATVYKTVTLLKDVGEVLELGFSDDSNHYDAKNPQPHPHLICVQCRSITDPVMNVLGTLANEVATETGYEILNHRLDFFGICPQCQRRD
jgi:Fur family peroxide stress response transcriptional regulator